MTTNLSSFKMLRHHRCLLLLTVVLLAVFAQTENESVDCDEGSAFREFDGSCNNLANPLWGRTRSLHLRLLDPRYDNDDGNTPRLYEESGSGNLLPSVRMVSNRIHFQFNEPRPSAGVTMMHMQWGQFLDHDITHTELMEADGCCDDARLTTSYIHPDVFDDGPCFPFIAPDRDKYFNTTADNKCLTFRRSKGYKDENGIRQQMNELTPWVDASHIYGPSKEWADELRTFEDGLLNSTLVDGDEFLPEWGDPTQCFILDLTKDYCFRAGDHRVNHFVGLTAMHTVFLRFHNSLAKRLKKVHGDWSDERLYQEARKIVGAVMQKITFNDYLRHLLGEENAKEVDLLTESTYSYEPSTAPTLSNVFVSAAFRYGHTAIPPALNVDGVDIKAGEMYMRPNQVLNHLDGILTALIDLRQDAIDPWYADGTRNQLFEPPKDPGHGRDLPAINVQRGRDHGIPPYTAWRKYCNLPELKSFDDIDTGNFSFKLAYSSLDDIDMYSGGISENPVGGSTVGPTYTCLLKDQFRKLKFGDRFWYQNVEDESTAFTDSQITQINSVTLAKVICDTTGITQIQPDVFEHLGGIDNRPIPCENIEGIDIENNW